MFLRKLGKTAPWTSQGNDIMQTLSRYYSNTFSDQEKQHTMNLFLGLFIPEENKPPIWDLVTDYYLHHLPSINYLRKSSRLTQWWDVKMLPCLPYPFFEITKACLEIIQMNSCKEEQIDTYYDYYRPYELSLLSEVYAYQISHSVRDFMPHFTTNFSPFVVRIRPGRRREETGNKNINLKNPSLTGQCSTSSTASSASSSMTSSDEEENYPFIDPRMTELKNNIRLTFEELFPTVQEMYGIQPEHPKRNDVLLYKKFVSTEKNSSGQLDCLKFPPKLIDQECSFVHQENSKAKNTTNYSIYKKHVQFPKLTPDYRDVVLYHQHVFQYQLNLNISNFELNKTT